MADSGGNTDLPDIVASDGCPVVGVGASAGGLEAFQRLISVMQPDSELALVMVQHLDPDHESLLHELLNRHSNVPVHSIEDGMAILAGNIYIIPPGAALTVDGYVMRLNTFEEPRGLRRPIDEFFESLAAHHGSNAAGVVLSGTGSDGSVGIRAVKEGGGLVLVQDPHQAKYDGMPRSAINTGAADLVVPAQDIVDVASDYFRRNAGMKSEIADDADLIARVTKHVLYRTGHDFSHYKPATLLRRIGRRMSVLNLIKPSEYLQKLISDATEADRLLNDFLINVTYFFRDPQVFEAIRTTIIPTLLDGKGKGEEIRVWAPGCSTGQEAYSLAMLFANEMARMDLSPTVNIFATDIDENALEVARIGEYSSAIINEVPADYLERYFNIKAGGYSINSEIRSMVRFSKHNFTKDAPFSRLDMISCRNTVIYFDKWLQQQVMGLFHYAIKPDGYLVLGPSEHLGESVSHFDVVNSGAKIFKRLQGAPRSLSLPLGGGVSFAERLSERAIQNSKPEPTLESQFCEAVAKRHAPPFAVIDANQRVVYSSEGMERYLRIKAGSPDLDILALVKDALRPPLRRLIAARPKDGSEPGQIEWSGEIDGDEIALTLCVDSFGRNKHRLVIFRDSTARSASVANEEAAGQVFNIDYDYVHTLEDELESARQTVRNTVEELETSNEELKSSNEEMMAMNEELQSANEELTTVNDELMIKVRQLDEAYGDLSNFVESTDIASVFLDDKLRIRRFTPAAKRYFRTTENDHGRPFNDLASDLDADRIAEMCAAVLVDSQLREEEQQTEDGKEVLRVSVLPYKTPNKGNLGVIILLVPITELRQYARDLESLKLSTERSLAEIEEIYRVSPQAMGLLAPDLTYMRVNKRLADINGRSIEDHFGKAIYEIVPELSDQVVEPVKQVFETGEPILGVDVRGVTAADPNTVRHWEMNWYPIFEGGAVSAVGINVQDMTPYHHMSDELRRVMLELQHRVKNMLSNVIALVNIAGRGEGDPSVVYDTLVNRISALAKTHNLLAESDWRGTSLLEILELELLQVYGEERVALRGPKVFMNSKASVAFSMTMHELATNAAKYGALSVDSGELFVSWAKIDEGDGEHIVLNWVERGGPPAKEPEAPGFGTQLIRSTIESSLGGSIDKRHHEDGYSAVIKMPTARLNQRDNVGPGF